MTTQKIKQVLGLAAGGTKVYVRNPDGAITEFFACRVNFHSVVGGVIEYSGFRCLHYAHLELHHCAMLS